MTLAAIELVRRVKNMRMSFVTHSHTQPTADQGYILVELARLRRSSHQKSWHFGKSLNVMGSRVSHRMVGAYRGMLGLTADKTVSTSSGHGPGSSGSSHRHIPRYLDATSKDLNATSQMYRDRTTLSDLACLQLAHVKLDSLVSSKLRVVICDPLRDHQAVLAGAPQQEAVWWLNRYIHICISAPSRFN